MHVSVVFTKKRPTFFLFFPDTTCGFCKEGSTFGGNFHFCLDYMNICVVWPLILIFPVTRLASWVAPTKAVTEILIGWLQYLIH